MNKYEWQASLRTHLPGCAECVFRSRCTGIFRVYLEMHGGDEFRPVRREDLPIVDPEQRAFVLLVEPQLAPLRAALAAGELPTTWRLARESSEDRRRQVELVFAHDTDGIARVASSRPGRGHLPVLSAPPYDVDVDADLGVSTDALATLLDWLRLHLAGGAGRRRRQRGRRRGRPRPARRRAGARPSTRDATGATPPEPLRRTRLVPGNAALAERYGGRAGRTRPRGRAHRGALRRRRARRPLAAWRRLRRRRRRWGRVKPIVAQLVSLLRGSQPGTPPGIAAVA